MSKLMLVVKLCEGVSRNDTDVYPKLIKALDKQVLKEVMELCRFNQSQAARVLGLSRGTLRTKLKNLFDDKYVGTRSN